MFLALTASWVLFVAAVALAAPGELDPTFGTNGWVLEGLDDGHTERVTDVGVSADGRIVVVGSLDDGFAVWRFLPSGEPDVSFGAGGLVTVPFVGRQSRAESMVLGEDGEVIAAGYAGGRIAVVRLAADGTLDPSFGGGDGSVRIRVAPKVRASAADAALLADGGIVLGASIRSQGSPRTATALVSLTPDGAVDEGFGSEGIVLRPQGFGALALTEAGILVALQPRSELRMVLARYDLAGVPDPAFGGDGVRRYCVYGDACEGGEHEGASDIATGASGSIIVLLRVEFSHGVVMRFTPDGRRDRSFSDDGVSDIVPAASLAVQDDGKIVVAGSVLAGGGSGEDHPYLAGLTADGTPDPSFGTDGHVEITPPASAPYYMDGVDVALRSDGRIIVLNEPAYDYLYDSFSLARLLGA